MDEDEIHFGGGDHTDGVRSRSSVRHQAKWENRFNSLATDAFLGTLDHVRVKAQKEQSDALELQESGNVPLYDEVDTGERSFPTETIDTTRQGKRTTGIEKSRHETPDNVFKLTYKLYQDWMVRKQSILYPLNRKEMTYLFPAFSQSL